MSTFAGRTTVRERLDSFGSSRCVDQSTNFSFAGCLDKQFNHPLRLFCVYQFLHLVYPFATASFRRRSTLLRVHPSLCRFVKAYGTLRVLRLVVLPLCRLYVLAYAANGFTYLAYSTGTGSQVPPLRLSVSPGGFIPDAANTSGNG
jgi:hypothetical protein